MKGNQKTSPPPAASEQRVFLLCAVLVLSVFVLYWPATGYEFSHYDDLSYYANNPNVQSGLNPRSVLWAFTTGTLSNWHPLTWLSFMVDVEFGGGTDPAIPHFTNILFHAVNSALLFWVLLRMTGAKGRSFLVAALFALHPLNVESVAWVAERKNVLSTLFWFLALLAYVRFAAERVANPGPSIWRNRNYLLALLWFGFGLMSKPMLVTLPFTLLLLDVWPLSRLDLSRWGKARPRPSAFNYQLSTLIWEKRPFFLLSIFSSIVTYVVQKQSLAIQSAERFPLIGRIENAFVSYQRYLLKTFWPDDLAVVYPHPGRWPASVVALSVALILFITLLACWKRKEGCLFVGWFWFLGTLIPVIGLVQAGIQSMADRYAYVPLIGIFLLLTWGGGALCHRLKIPVWGTAFIAGLVIVACCVVTRHQMGFWKNDGALFGHALQVTANNAHAHVTLGVYLEKIGDKPGALQHYEAAIAVDANEKNAHFNRGNILDDLGRPDEAVLEYREAIRISPDFIGARYNLALLLSRLGRNEEAVQEFRRVLRLNPDLSSARQQLERLEGSAYVP